VEIRKVRTDCYWVIEAPFSVSISPERLCEITRTTERTIAGWIRNNHIPEATQDLLRHCALGMLLDKHWRGWHICDEGRLWAPNGYSFYPNDLQMFQQYRQLNDMLKDERDDERSKRIDAEARVAGFENAFDQSTHITRSGRIVATHVRRPFNFFYDDEVLQPGHTIHDKFPIDIVCGMLKSYAKVLDRLKPDHTLFEFHRGPESRSYFTFTVVDRREEKMG